MIILNKNRGRFLSSRKAGYSVLKALLYGVCLSSVLASSPGYAYDGVVDYFKKTKISGNLRAYFFERAYTNPNKVDQNAFSLGGYVSALSAPLYGFQAGLTLGAANSLGLNPINPKRNDSTLPGNTIYVLTEAFVQYQNKYLLFRGPDQIVDTPWVMPSDSRMTPASFRGAYTEITPFVNYKPLKSLTLVALHMTDFNGRADGVFSPTNLYFPNHNGGAPVSALAGQSVPGVTSVGLKYGDKKTDPYQAQLWYNKFYNFSQLLWLDTSYTYKTKSGFNPLFGFQFANQWGDGSNMLAQVGQGAAANTQAYGFLAGLDTPYVTFTAAYNGIVKKQGFNANGDLVSPYSIGYSTDPLYTTQMIGGIIEKQSPGSAFKVAATSYFLNKQIKAMVSFAEYYITSTNSYNSHPHETDLDLTYSFPKKSVLKGFSIRNRFGVMTGNIQDGHFYYERFQLQYQFE